MTSGSPDPATAVNGAPASPATSADEPDLVMVPPTGYLDVAALDFVPWQELADRRIWLLNAIESAGPGPDVRLPGGRAAALALVAVLAELDTRARAHEAGAGHHYWCTCGFTCVGLAAFDNHMDPFPSGGHGSDEHEEIIRRTAGGTRQAGRMSTPTSHHRGRLPPGSWWVTVHDLHKSKLHAARLAGPSSTDD